LRDVEGTVGDRACFKKDVLFRKSTVRLQYLRRKKNSKKKARARAGAKIKKRPPHVKNSVTNKKKWFKKRVLLAS